MVLVPGISGMLAVHVTVPVAEPADPVEFDQLTNVTPTLSVAMP